MGRRKYTQSDAHIDIEVALKYNKSSQSAATALTRNLADIENRVKDMPKNDFTRAVEKNIGKYRESTTTILADLIKIEKQISALDADKTKPETLDKVLTSQMKHMDGYAQKVDALKKSLTGIGKAVGVGLEPQLEKDLTILEKHLGKVPKKLKSDFKEVDKEIKAIRRTISALKKRGGDSNYGNQLAGLVKRMEQAQTTYKTLSAIFREDLKLPPSLRKEISAMNKQLEQGEASTKQLILGFAEMGKELRVLSKVEGAGIGTKEITAAKEYKRAVTATYAEIRKQKQKINKLEEQYLNGRID